MIYSQSERLLLSNKKQKIVPVNVGRLQIYFTQVHTYLCVDKKFPKMTMLESFFSSEFSKKFQLTEMHNKHPRENISIFLNKISI